MTSLKRPASSDSSDDDTPEAVSFGSSKKVAKSERHVVERFHEAQKQKQKEQNRVLDRVLKDRAADSKGKDKGKAKDAGRRQKGKSSGEDAPDGEEDEEGLDDAAGGTSREELEARMARAMMEAEDEEDEEDEEEEGGSAFAGLSGHDIEMGEEASDEEDEDGDEGEDEDEDGDEEMGSGDGEDEDDDDDDEEGDEDDEDDEDDEVINRQKQRYLPDHLFKSALASVPSRNSKIVFGDEAAPARSSSTHLHKRRRTKRPSKDIILGSRTIRTLAKPSAATKSLVPPKRVAKFVKASLNLKADSSKAKSKGWSRRPANLGVMKRSGPAANFARNA